MAQAADTGGSGGGAPFAKFARIGDMLVGSFGGGKTRQQQDFEKKTPKWKDHEGGKALLEEVMWFSAMPGTTAFTGNVDSPATIAVGDVVRYAVGGFKWGQVIDARKGLPAYAGFPAGQACSGDVYTIRLAGWSIDTDNPDAAQRAGFVVAQNRIVMRTLEEKQKYVMMRIERNQPAVVGNDFEITIRRPNPDEKAFEQAGDALFASKPWERQTEMATAGGGGYNPADDEPF